MITLSYVWFKAGVATMNAMAFVQDTTAQPPAAGGAAGTEDFTLWGMIQKMGWVARVVAIILFIMSMYSIAVMVERFLTYNAAKKQSREFAPKVAAALRDNRIEEAINISDRYKKSHLAMVVNAGLQDIQAAGISVNVIDSQSGPSSALRLSRRPSSSAASRRSRRSARRPRSWVCSVRWSASSTRSRA